MSGNLCIVTAADVLFDIWVTRLIWNHYSGLRSSQQREGWAVPFVQGTAKISHWHTVAKPCYL